MEQLQKYRANLPSRTGPILKNRILESRMTESVFEKLGNL